MKNIAILGTGCPKCVLLAKHSAEAADQMGIEYNLVKVTDIQEIMNYGVMMTPGLVIDGQVKSVGKVLTVQQIKEILK